MDTRPDRKPDEQAVEPQLDPATSHLFGEGTTRTLIINIVIVIAMIAIAIQGWPTETRKLDRRAHAYVKAGLDGESKVAWAHVAPTSRERIRQDIWWAANQTKLANTTVVSSVVNPDGKSGTVTFKDNRNNQERPTTWVKQEGQWYLNYGGE